MSTTREKPILFSGSMVRAVLNGTKTQTRRVVTSRSKEHLGLIQDILSNAVDLEDRPNGVMIHGDSPTNYGGEVQMNDWSTFLRSPYGQPGDRLWVRETHAEVASPNRDEDPEEFPGPWTPSIHMPRWASRLTLEVVSVRVERLQEISEEDVKAEGVTNLQQARGVLNDDWTHLDAYRRLWESINGPGSWGANPFVWVVEFNRIEE